MYNVVECHRMNISFGVKYTSECTEILCQHKQTTLYEAHRGWMALAPCPNVPYIIGGRPLASLNIVMSAKRLPRTNLVDKDIIMNPNDSELCARGLQTIVKA